MALDLEEYLNPTFIIDSDNPVIQHETLELTGGKKDVIEKAVTLFYFVRDTIRYNPYTPKSLQEDYKASCTLSRRYGYCVQKAALLCALGRNAGIPCRLGFATIRNHIVPEKLSKLMKTDIFVYHGYVEFYIEEKWVKATPAFDIGMCRDNKIIPVEFDGISDAVFHSHNREGKLHIEYLADLGRYSDVPVEKIWTESIRMYGSKEGLLPE